jgi:hypothetical protein
LDGATVVWVCSLRARRFLARRRKLVSNRREDYEVNMLAHSLQQILQKPEWAHKHSWLANA